MSHKMLPEILNQLYFISRQNLINFIIIVSC